MACSEQLLKLARAAMDIQPRQPDAAHEAITLTGPAAGRPQ